MNVQNDQSKTLLSFQNVRTILSLAYIDSKIPKSTLMKIEIKQVLGCFFILCAKISQGNFRDCQSRNRARSLPKRGEFHLCDQQNHSKEMLFFTAGNTRFLR